MEPFSRFRVNMATHTHICHTEGGQTLSVRKSTTLNFKRESLIANDVIIAVFLMSWRTFNLLKRKNL